MVKQELSTIFSYPPVSFSTKLVFYDVALHGIVRARGQTTFVVALSSDSGVEVFFSKSERVLELLVVVW